MTETLSIKVAISSGFLKQMNTLDRKIRRSIDKFVKNFQSNPTATSHNYEKIKNASDPNFRSVRVNDDYRAIVHKPDKGDVYLLCWVDKHDDAYKWAVRRRCQVHPRTGSIQIYIAEEISEPVGQAPKPQDATPKRPEPKETPLFSLFTDEQLIGLGTPTELLPLVRSVCNNGAFIEIQTNLPDEAIEGLLWLKEGIPYDEIMEMLHSNMAKRENQEDFDTEDVQAALERASTKRSFWVAENERQLQEMLDAPLEQWRIFLHPSQRKYVEKDFSGSTRVLGGAGTGKTVVAMHRAVHLASKVFTEANDRILFTTFTKNLAIDIKNAMETLGSPKTTERIEVIHLHGWVLQFLKNQNYQYTVGYFDDKSGKKLKKLWSEALLLAPALGLSESFYREEWEQIVQYHGINSAKEYGRIKRSGRGSRLSKRQRLEIWTVFEEYRRLLEENGIREHIDAIRDARILLKEKPHLTPFKAIIVDEAQDLSPAAYRLIRALVPEGPNDIFVVGDGHQRIYKYKVTLKKCDINIVGRSYRLKINYRTTDEIRKHAVRILKDIKIDNLDGGEDNLKGYISLLHGPPPTIKKFSSLTDELNFIQSILAREDVEHHRTCLVVRTQDFVNRYTEALSKTGIKLVQIRRSEPTDNTKLRIATMHRVKGLEFDCVIIAGVNAMVMPNSKAISQGDDEQAKEAAEIRERCLLYVALTRAKREAFITSHGIASSLLD